MEFALIVWFVTSLSAINNLLLFLAVIVLFGAIGFAIRSVDDYFSNEARISYSKTSKKFAISFIPLAFALAITPSTKTGWMMVAAYTAQTALQSESAKKLGAIAEIKLQEVLDEVTEQSKIKTKSINEPKKEN